MAALTNKTVFITQNEEKPEPLEVVAQAILEVAEAFKKINSSSLKRRAIVLLLEDMIPSHRRVYRKDIETILEYAPLIKQQYVKDDPQPVKTTKKPVKK